MRAAFVFLVLLMASPLSAEDKIRVTYPDGAPRIASEFLDRMGINGRWRSMLHQGIDIMGPSGMPVLAAADGVVLETDIGDCWGPTVVIDHGKDRNRENLIVAYGHLGNITVEAGQTITRGQQIGDLGDNQSDFRCIAGVRHLHFQIGRRWTGPDKGERWGHSKYLRDGGQGVNPHLYWSGGVGKVTCFEEGAIYRTKSLTYPVPCS